MSPHSFIARHGYHVLFFFSTEKNVLCFSFEKILRRGETLISDKELKGDGVSRCYDLGEGRSEGQAIKVAKQFCGHWSALQHTGVW